MAVTEKNVLDALAERIHEAFPERVIYVNQQEQDFKRPSFFIDPVTWTRTRKNIGTDETAFYITVYCLEKLTVNRNGDLFQALATADKIEGLFRMGILKVGDRCIRIETSRGEQDRGECAVDFIARWTDWNGYDPDKGYPMMQEVHTDMRETEKGEKG